MLTDLLTMIYSIENTTNLQQRFTAKMNFLQSKTDMIDFKEGSLGVNMKQRFQNWTI